MLAFVHIQKTAGTTLTSILRRSFGVRHFDARGVCNLGNLTAAQLRRVAVVYPWLQSLAGHAIRPFGDLETFAPDLRYYTFFREPVARTISHVFFDLQKGLTRLDDSDDPRTFLRDYLARRRNTQTRHLVDDDDAERAIDLCRRKVRFIGVVERFDESLVLFQRWAASPTLDITYVSQNVSRSKLPSRFQALSDALREDGELREMVRETNQEDLRLYRWACDEAFPAQQRDFGPELPRVVAEFQDSNRRARPFWWGDSIVGKIYRNVVFKPWGRVSGLKRAA